LPVSGTKVAGVWKEWGLRGSTYTVWPLRKDLVVMSQWAHITRNWECPWQLLPALLLWQPSQWMEEAGGRCPCFVCKLSQISVAWGKWR
jgi:hypothetical protein